LLSPDTLSMWICASRSHPSLPPTPQITRLPAPTPPLSRQRSCPPPRPQALAYFPYPEERSTINTLALAAQLASQTLPHAQQQQQQPQPQQPQQPQPQQQPPTDTQWVRVYAHPLCSLVLEVLAAWMPEPTAAQFITFHEVSVQPGRVQARRSRRVSRWRPSDPRALCSLRGR
jgi:hypothetical protein